MMMKFDRVEVLEGDRCLCTIAYASLKTLEWDHAMTGWKLELVVSGRRTGRRSSSWWVRVANSLEPRVGSEAETSRIGSRAAAADQLAV